MTVILASGSPFRAMLLNNAGVAFSVETASINERDTEKPLLDAGLDAGDVAEVLAIAKATDVSNSHPGAWVIGADQTLGFDGKLLHKPADAEEAIARLLALSGKTHHLHSAVAIVKDGEVLWQHVERCAIAFRNLTPAFVGKYVSAAGEEILSSVGAYQIEGPGVQLIEKMEGDYFSVMGLPLLPLLEQMRKLDLLER